MDPMKSLQKRSLSESSNEWLPLKKRRESQASTTTASNSEEHDHDAIQRLNQVLESNSDSEDESTSTSFPTFSHSMNENPSGATSNTKSNNGAQYSSISMKLMASMGYKAGTGLGKAGQGIVEPVAASMQRGQRGLGYIIKALEDEKVQWDASKEVVEVEERVEWLPSNDEPCPSIRELKSWLKEGPRKETISDETEYCQKEILDAILKSKTIFDELEGHEMRKARTRSNPFEIISSMFFLNRAAMKMANMDAVFDFIFTEPRDQHDKPLLDSNSLLYFADVCAGPGGFSEYVLWRKRWRAKGFGFTIKGKNDFKLEDFLAGSPESFETHYGENGRDGDGDVFKENNIVEFTKFVLENTNGQGVHFMMADGGFGVEGQENIQEILSKQLYLCQFLVALNIVRTGGHFVCKLFDLFTPFSAGLVYLMYRAFDQVCLHKPNTSRPANSERYIICKGKRPHMEPIRDYMFQINRRLNQLGFDLNGGTQSDIDIIEIVPRSILNDNFVDYLRRSNDMLGERQIVSLVKIRAYYQDSNLHETRQTEIRDQCLKLWKVEKKVRKAPVWEEPQVSLKNLLGLSGMTLVNTPISRLTPRNIDEKIKSIYDWKCVLIAGNPTFFLGMGGRNRNYFYNQESQKWNRCPDALKFDLPANTLIFAEEVVECRGIGKGMRKGPGLHILDALFIAGEDLREKELKLRNAMLKTLVQSMAKPSQPDHVIMRVKDIFGLENIEQQCLSKLTLQMVKGHNGLKLTANISQETIRLLNGEEKIIERFVVPTGIIMFPIVKPPYLIAFSKSQQRKYWFNFTNRESSYECPPSAMVDVRTSIEQRLLWPWDEGVQLFPKHEVRRDENKLHLDRLLDFCKQKK